MRGPAAEGTRGLLTGRNRGTYRRAYHCRFADRPPVHRIEYILDNGSSQHCLRPGGCKESGSGGIGPELNSWSEAGLLTGTAFIILCSPPQSYIILQQLYWLDLKMYSLD